MIMVIKISIINFLIRKNAVAALEMTFILPILLILIMGLVEFSTIFSLRAGIEEVARQIARVKLSRSGATNYGITIGSTDPEDKILTDLIHEKLVSIVLKPQNTQICVSKSPFLSNFARNINLTSECINFSSDPNTEPTALNMGNPGDYVKIQISYQHDYLTPMGKILNFLGNGTTTNSTSFSTVTYFRKEV
jgi:hypothetical protein